MHKKITVQVNLQNRRGNWTNVIKHLYYRVSEAAAHTNLNRQHFIGYLIYSVRKTPV